MAVSGGDVVGADGLDTIIFSPDDSGTVHLTGATARTDFDFTDLGPYVTNPDGTVTQGISRGDVTFDAAGRMYVDGDFADLVVAGGPYHSGAEFNAGISNGDIVLSETFDWGGRG